MTKKSRAGDRAAKREPRATTRLFLEALEDRTLLSATLLSHYNGINFNTSQGFVPPDTTGAAGTNGYVETTNQEVALFTPKTTGAKNVSDSLTDFYFIQGRLPNADSTSRLSDPTVVWDEKIQRFIVADQDVDFGTHVSNFDIAVSKSANPTTLTRADWNFSFVSTTEASFDADYPGNMGWNNDSLVFTLNMFPTGANPFHVQVDSVNIKALVNGTPLTLGANAFANDFSGGSLRPTVMHDSKAGDPMWLVEEAGNGTDINVVKMTNVLSAAATFTTTSIGVTPYSRAVPELQPNGNALTFNTDSRIMKAAMQNGLIVAAQQVSDAAGDLDKVQWYVINTTGATPTLQQQGDITGGKGTYYAYPGIDINPAGDIGISYIASGTAKGAFMSTYITGRTPTEAKGTMEKPILVQAGAGNYSDFTGFGREGDLSGINVDSDGSFWISNEFANTNAFANWGTTIAHFSFGPSVPPLPGVSITGRVFQDQSHSGKEVPTDPGLAGVTVYIDAANVGHYVNGDPAVITAADGTYKFPTLVPGDYQIGAVVKANYAQSSPSGGSEQPVSVSANATVFGVDFGDYKLGPYTIVDDSDGPGSFRTFGLGWRHEAGGLNSESLYHAATFSPGSFAQWTTTAAVPGRAGTYELYASWVAKPNNATNATYTIFDQPTNTMLGTVTVDQTQAPTQANVNGTLFQELGTFTSSNGSFIIQLDPSGITGNVPIVNVVADAIVEASPVQLPMGSPSILGPSRFAPTNANAGGPPNNPNTTPNGAATSQAVTPSTASLDSFFIRLGSASGSAASAPTTAVLSSNGSPSASGAFSAAVTHTLAGDDMASVDDLFAGLGQKKQASGSTGNSISS